MNIETEFIKNLNNDIEYFDDYKKRLIQFIITNCCYSVPYSSKDNYIGKIKKRLHFTPQEMLDIIKEILMLELKINKLKSNKKQIEYV